MCVRRSVSRDVTAGRADLSKGMDMIEVQKWVTEVDQILAEIRHNVGTSFGKMDPVLMEQRLDELAEIEKAPIVEFSDLTIFIGALTIRKWITEDPDLFTGGRT